MVTAFDAGWSSLWLGNLSGQHGLTPFWSPPPTTELSAAEWAALLRPVAGNRLADSVVKQAVRPCNELIIGPLVRLRDIAPSLQNASNSSDACSGCKARRWLRPGLTLESFFDALNAQAVHYVILRWFEQLPSVKPGEDLDLLFLEEDEAKLSALLQPQPPETDSKTDSPKFDVYSDTGNKGSSYGGLPYIQRNLAVQLLRNRRLHKGRYYVPAPEEHLLSLAYHVVYHKALVSGLATKNVVQTRKALKTYRDAGHDYEALLLAKADDLQVDIRGGAPSNTPLNLDQLHAFLRGRNWAPELDLGRKYATQAKSPDSRSWLESVFPAAERSSAANNGTVHVFVLRAWAYDHGLLPFVLSILEHAGLGATRVLPIATPERQRAADVMRGGNWGRGPYYMAGGPPAAAIVVFDPNPKPACEGKANSACSKYLTNGAILLWKETIRKLVNRLLPRSLQHNCLHSSDDDSESWDYLKSIARQERVDELRRDIEQQRKYFMRHRVPGVTFLRQLSKHNYNRAQTSSVEWVDGSGRRRPAILKVFKGWATRFLAREAFAYTTLRSLAPLGSIPRLLARGDQYIVIETLEHDAQAQARLFRTAKTLRQLASWLQWFTQSSPCWIHADLHPENVIVLLSGRVAVIDFEMLQECNSRYPSVSAARSWDVSLQPPGGVCLELPMGGGSLHERLWRRKTGHTLSEILARYGS